jgi:hypothetical protein
VGAGDARTRKDRESAHSVKASTCCTPATGVRVLLRGPRPGDAGREGAGRPPAFGLAAPDLIAASLEKDARQSDKRVRAGNLISAYAFVSGLAYKSEVAAGLNREAGFTRKCPGEMAEGSE